MLRLPSRYSNSAIAGGTASDGRVGDSLSGGAHGSVLLQMVPVLLL